MMGAGISCICIESVDVGEVMPFDGDAFILRQLEQEALVS